MKHNIKRLLALTLSLIFILSLFVFSVSASELSEKTILYVATNGKDTNSGTEDAPLATITGARDTIRAMKKAGTLGEGGAVVYIRGGNYIIQKGIEFTAEDSGTEDAPIVYRNYPDEKVEFTGAANVSWSRFKKTVSQDVLDRIVDKNAKSKILELDLFALGYTELPELPLIGSYSYVEGMKMIHGMDAPEASAPELVINGTPMTIARYPNDAYMMISEVVEEGANPRDWESDRIGSDMYIPPELQIPTPFTIKFDNDRVGYWTQADEALITGMFRWSWASQTVPVASVDPQKGTLTSKYPSEYSVIAGQPVYVYNLIEEIDAPGEYYVDRKAGKLYLYPPQFTPETIVYTTLDEIMFNLKGTQYMTIRGINMSYMRNSALMTDADTKFFNLIGCEISETGKRAVSMDGYNNGIYDCYFHDVDGAIVTKGGDIETLTPGNIVIENCEFKACDKISKTYNEAVKLQGVGNKLLSCKLSESDHMIVGIGGNENVIAFNEIFNACKYADDMGAIYTCRDITRWGHVIAHNYIHDIKSSAKQSGASAQAGGAECGVQAIFFDDWWECADIYGNVFENIGGHVWKGGGSHNKLYNNIMINCQSAGYFFRPHEADATMSRNTHYNKIMKDSPYWQTEIWQKHFPGIENLYTPGIEVEGDYSSMKTMLLAFDIEKDVEAYNNVLYNTGDMSISQNVEAQGRFENNVKFTGDPGFYDLAGGNYLLRDDSEVYKKLEDFEPILFTRMGMYSDRAMARVKDSYVVCADSPYTIDAGKKVKGEITPAKFNDGELYISLRKALEAIGGVVDFDAETNEVKLSTGTTSVTFTSGESITLVNVNGEAYQLAKPIQNMSETNYISVTDLAAIFGVYVKQTGDIAVISRGENLFVDEVDDELLRYYEDTLTIY